MKIRFCTVGASCLELDLSQNMPNLYTTENPETRITPSRMDVARFIRAVQLKQLDEIFKKELAELAGTSSVPMKIVT